MPDSDISGNALATGFVGSTADGHAGLQNCSRPILGLDVGGSRSVITVFRRPVEFVVVIDIVHRIFCLVTGCVDKCK
jgi:hypothetical protein